MKTTDTTFAEYTATLRELRESYADEVAAMPDAATTAGQSVLQAKHGTPREFAAAIVRAMGDMISPAEGEKAMAEYLTIWNAA